MSDKDGRNTYSDIIVVDNNSCGFSIYPNPVAKDRRLILETPIPGHYNLQLYTLEGAIVHSQTLWVSSSAITATLPTAIDRCLYLVKISKSNGATVLQQLLFVQ